MKYIKKQSDGYTKVGAGACQLQTQAIGVKLGVIHSNVQPSPTDAHDFVFSDGSGVHQTLGSEDCYVIVLSDTLVEFSATEI